MTPKHHPKPRIENAKPRVLQILRVFLIDGEKGGVGKSVLARTLMDYSLSHTYPVVGIECDRSNQSFLDFFIDVPDVDFRHAFFSEDAKKAWNADFLVQTAIEILKHVIADLPAQTFRPQVDYFTKGGLRAAERHGVQFIKFFLCADRYSLAQFKQSVNALGNDIPHILVLNEGLCDDFSFIEEDATLRSLIANKEIPVIRLPEIPYRENELINHHRLTFSQALQHPDITLVGRQRIADYLAICAEQFDALGLFNDERQTSQEDE
jgi:hypothetical protein